MASLTPLATDVMRHVLELARDTAPTGREEISVLRLGVDAASSVLRVAQKVDDSLLRQKTDPGKLDQLLGFLREQIALRDRTVDVTPLPEAS